MIYELRQYTIAPGKMPAVQARFRDASGEFLAHAWVEVDGVPLGEPAGTLDGFHTVPLEAFLAATGDAARR